MGSLSNLQVELLKLYSTNITEKQLLEIRQLLAEYFSKLIDQEMQTLQVERGWDEKTIEQWKSERLRKPSA